MLKVRDNFRIKMFYNDGYTIVEDNSLSLSGAEYIVEKYSKNNKIDYKYYIIYHDITIKILGITIAKRSYRLKEWGQYDEV